MNWAETTNAALKAMEEKVSHSLFFGQSREEKKKEFLDDLEKLDLAAIKKVCSDLWECKQDGLIALDKMDRETSTLKMRTSEWIQKCSRLEGALKFQIKVTRQMLRIKND